MFPGLSVRKSGPAAWQVSYAVLVSDTKVNLG